MIVFYVFLVMLDELIYFLKSLPFFTFVFHFFLHLALNLHLRLQISVPQLLV